MTVSYALAVSSADGYSFLKLFKKWEGSIFKVVWKELLLWLVLYYIITITVQLTLPQEWKQETVNEIQLLDYGLSYFDIKFMLGFFVSCVVDRWKQMLQNITFIETTALSVSTLIRGKDDNVRLARRSIVRYLVLSQVLVFRDISMQVRRRYPTMKSLIESGFLFENELRELKEIDVNYKKYWAPINWANSIVWRMNANIRDFRKDLENMCKFDWVPIPIAYPQVVFLAVRVYFLIALFSRQHLPLTEDDERLIKYIPIMTIFQFIFFVGWMRVAEALLNPLGEDDDDFELNWVLEKNIMTGMQIVDDSHDECPYLNIDKFSDPKFQPLSVTGAHTGHSGGLQGSTSSVVIDEVAGRRTSNDAGGVTINFGEKKEEQIEVPAIVYNVGAKGRVGVNDDQLNKIKWLVLCFRSCEVDKKGIYRIVKLTMSKRAEPSSSEHGINAQIRNHEWLNSPFFKLCISTAVIDLITMLNNYLGAMFPKWSFFIDFYLKIGNIYGQIYLYIAWTTGCCQSFSVSILAANRLSAVIFPGNYSSMFWYHRIWIPISIQFVPGCLLGIMTLFNPAQLYRNSTNGIVPKFTIKKMTNIFYVIGGFLIGSNCIFLICTYLYIFYVIKSRKKLHSMFGVQNFAMVCSQYRSILFNPQLFKRCLFGN
ncbi:unnamed protein product [Caenorhabditis bovis]|uniref:Bestrophin homolog n=1 Tax=Caenorhabditis bovis TaxID=2654633 RepID=A0A8S1F9K1_9PELO|nr:unnamed protein product [Caenorhabditis bovis]